MNQFFSTLKFFAGILVVVTLAACGQSEEVVVQLSPEEQSRVLVDDFNAAILALDKPFIAENICEGNDPEKLIGAFEDEISGPPSMATLKELKFELVEESASDSYHVYEASYFGAVGGDLLDPELAKNEENFQEVVFMIGVNLVGEACVDEFR